MQTKGADCGIFVVMYAWYIIERNNFDFIVDDADLPHLRVWLFKKLSEACNTSRFSDIVGKIHFKDGWGLFSEVAD